MNTGESTSTARPFSLSVFLLIVFGLSWPFQIAYIIFKDNPTSSMILSSLSMIMVTVGAFICGKWIFRDGFKGMGWNFGKPWHFAAVFGLALFIFGLPVLIENLSGLHTLPAGFAVWPLLGGFLAKAMITTIPGFGEEFGWRAYLLPRLSGQYGARKGLLIHAVIWWFWHFPAIAGIAMGTSEPGTPVWLTFLVLTLITLIPSTMNAVLFAYVWSASGSLAVASVYHSLFDEVRDALEQYVGFGPLVSLWEMAATTLLGGWLLWKMDWKSLLNRSG